jgi:KaiC/GvpD/RAD55 family RecA-like ATPase
MYCRLIPAKWMSPEYKVVERDFTDTELKTLNQAGYSIYAWPNSASELPEKNISGTDIDIFEYVFVDMDAKHGAYSKETFVDKLFENETLVPTKVIDSGNGIHAYWKVAGLDAKSYLRLTRRLSRYLNTDLATCNIAQLMRLEGYDNTKEQDNYKPCQNIFTSEATYTCEQLDSLLPLISLEDEKFCEDHYNSTYSLESAMDISGDLPVKFGALLKKNKEAAELFASATDDRSKSDYRLGHIMLGNAFTKEEAMNVLYNTAKAMQRGPNNRYKYAKGIVDKIWVFEETEKKETLSLSPTVREILSKSSTVNLGQRFPCHRLLDDTYRGFRLGQCIGIVAGSGVGKTTLTLNMFLWFAESNPDYHHFFFSLEQPKEEITERIKTICGENDLLFDRIHVIDNHNEDDSFKHLSLSAIEDQMYSWQESTGLKIGTAVIDHIGVLDSSNKNGENDALIGICKRMKPVARRLNIMLIMLSQAPREKAGIGDLELSKDAAFGTVFFESFLDYLICLWQPLKRVYAQGAPTIMSFKFGKIRHKNQKLDILKEDVCYNLYFDPINERLRELTQDEEISVNYFLNLALSERKKDRKTDIQTYVSRRLEEQPNEQPRPTTASLANSSDSKRH